MDYFKYLPSEITLDILTRLPTETVLDCKLVSRNWRNHIRHPLFGKMQLNHMNHPDTRSGKQLGFVVKIGNFDDDFDYFEYDDESTTIKRITMINLSTVVSGTRIIGSYNGLICFAGGPFAWIYNPITRECVMFPEIIIEKSANVPNYYSYWTSGFGYLSSTDEYKIVKIYMAETSFVQVYIYTLGSGNGWRNLGKFDFVSGSAWREGLFANGNLYFPDYKSERIITFDLAEEKFREHLSPPQLPAGGNWFHYTTGVLDGVLYAVVGFRGERGFDVWMLKKKVEEQREGHISFVWSKEFRMDDCDLFGVTQSGGILTANFHHVSIYSTKTSTLKKLVKFGDQPLFVFPHKNTFVSLKQLEKEDTKTMESVATGEPRVRTFYFEED